MALKVSIPAISREMEFVAHNAAVAEEILEIESETTLHKLTYSVCMRANEDADTLLREIEATNSNATAGLVRLSWTNTNRAENWESSAKVYMPYGPMRRIGEFGFSLGYGPMPLRLIGWIWPRWGGLEGRREFVRVCNKKIKSVCLPSEYPDQYPGWGDNDGVIWFDELLTLRSSMQDVVNRTAREAKVMLKVGRPVLKQLADG